MKEAIAGALREAGFDTPLAAVRDLSGGCIHQVIGIELTNGEQVVAKLTDAGGKELLEEEIVSLESLARTKTVQVPQPMGLHHCDDVYVLVMSYLSPAPVGEEAWRRFGAQLAAMHMAPAGDDFGFHIDNHIGSTTQPNTRCDDWVRFNCEHRLGHQLRLLQQSELVRDGESRAIGAVIGRLADFIPEHPRPALLHGDLWSGNALGTSVEGAAVIAVIDPACSVGDAWADIAMMRLFGGFPQSCFDAYERRQTDHDRVEQRIAVYQLYHLLNHVNIFGRGYVSQAMAVIDCLLSM